MNTRYHIPLLLMLSALLFLTNLGGYDLWPPDEPRFAQVAREMLQSDDYLVPRINGQPYTEKPPMLFWLTAMVSAPLGDVTEFSARLPLALGGILTVLLTYLLARDLYGTRVALWTGLMLITTHRFWWQARFGQIDMLMTAFLTAALLCFWHWHKRRQTRALAGFYLCIAAAVLTKGPPGLVFPLFMAIAFYWKRKGERKGLHLILGTAMALVIAAAWLVPARMAISVESGMEAGDGIASNLFRQTIGRFFLGISHAQWPWFYVTNMPEDLLPWALFLPWTAYWLWQRRREGEEMRLLLCWTIPAFIFFSACIGKRSIYLLPLYPVLAIILSRSILDLVDSTRAAWRKNTELVWAALLLVASLAPFALLLTEYKAYWENYFVVASVCTAACGLHALYRALRTDARQLPRDMVAHASVLFLLCALLVFPAVNPHKSARGFCAPLRQLADHGTPYDLYSVGFSREEYVYYANHFHVPVLCELLPIPEMEQLPLYEQARLQSTMQRGIQKAVRDLPIAAFGDVTDAELEALHQAASAYQGPGDDQSANTASYENAVTKRLQQLFVGMDSDSPAFMMALEDDWRWVLALSPEARKYAVLSDTNVGSRRVLLLANPAGEKALDGLKDTAVSAAGGVAAETYPTYPARPFNAS